MLFPEIFSKALTVTNVIIIFIFTFKNLLI